ncbi:DNA/RNA non-specific endonuclease [Adlercreutzia sp. ZJ304]|uniref:DNA/RNA non-specific endonuclease n=1 Tax=Adlercreutzia sp. ZJ304 TaxID=2709791 RepID=UPI0013EC7E47|nr:DNA/RNA non-specific endonuclease [Adlercreutzia sp. ZJ304]
MPSKRCEVRFLAALLLALTLAFGCLPGCLPTPQKATPPVATSTTSSSADNSSSTDNSSSANAPAEAHPNAITNRALDNTTQIATITQNIESIQALPAFTEAPGVYINGNIPSFTSEDLALPYGTENYGQLDQLGRCTAAIAMVGPETEPTTKRGNISHIHPSGWVQARYPEIGLDHLYERSHMIAHCLTAEDANECNLITGTNYMNQGAMQKLEQKMNVFVDSTGNHILLRVTPDFHNEELVARGVQMEAYSLEDDGEAICFNVYLYNVQPGVQIDYSTGQSQVATSTAYNNCDPQNNGIHNAHRHHQNPNTL